MQAVQLLNFTLLMSFPYQSDRSPEDAATRETWEEMGIHPKNIHVLNRMDSWQERSLVGLQVIPIIVSITPPSVYDV